MTDGSFVLEYLRDGTMRVMPLRNKMNHGMLAVARAAYDGPLASALVISCLDPRIQGLRALLVRKLGLKGDYDPFSLAGASLGVVQAYGNAPSTATVTWPVYSNWGPTFFESVTLAVTLHGITGIVCIDHLDCSAYKTFLLPAGTKDTELAPHIQQIAALRALVAAYTDSDATMQAAVRALTVTGYILSPDGTITQALEDGSTVFIARGPPIDGEGGAACGACGAAHDSHATSGSWLLPTLIVIGLVGISAAALGMCRPKPRQTVPSEE